MIDFPGRYDFTIEILRLHYISQCCNYYKYGPVDGLLNAESMQVKALLHADVRSRPTYDLETIQQGHLLHPVVTHPATIGGRKQLSTS